MAYLLFLKMHQFKQKICENLKTKKKGDFQSNILKLKLLKGMGTQIQIYK